MVPRQVRVSVNSIRHPNTPHRFRLVLWESLKMKEVQWCKFDPNFDGETQTRCHVAAEAPEIADELVTRDSQLFSGVVLHKCLAEIPENWYKRGENQGTTWCDLIRPERSSYCRFFWCEVLYLLSWLFFLGSSRLLRSSQVLWKRTMFGSIFGCSRDISNFNVVVPVVPVVPWACWLYSSGWHCDDFNTDSTPALP